MCNMQYTISEQKLIKNNSISFIKMLIEKDIRSYKYNIMDENIIDYMHRNSNKTLYNVVRNHNISDDELMAIQSSIIQNSNYNLEVEYLPTEDWEFDSLTSNQKELVLAIPSYQMISDALALVILLFPFAALFLSYFLIMIFR